MSLAFIFLKTKLPKNETPKRRLTVLFANIQFASFFNEAGVRYPTVLLRLKEDRYSIIDIPSRKKCAYFASIMPFEIFRSKP